MDVMVDLETMSSESNAAIVSIGAVEFSKAGLGRELYLQVDLQSSMEAGLHVSAGTIKWWLRQSEEARERIYDIGYYLPFALLTFANWLEPIPENERRIWGNGATFDNVIMHNAYKAVNKPSPWKYYNDRCYRTLKALNPNVVLPERTGVAHNALDDAIYQAQCAIVILNQGEVK